MEFPVKLVLELNNQEEHTAINKAISGAAADLVGGCHLTVEEGELVEALHNRIMYRPVDETKEARVLINGQSIAVGTKQDMILKYESEVGMHARSNIVMQELINGEYKQVRARLLQQA